MNSKPQPPREDWDARLDRALKNLPDREAPPSLIPNVMARLQAQREVPWHQKSWWEWPAALRIGSLAGSLAMLLGLLWATGRLKGIELGTQLSAWNTELQPTLGYLGKALDSVAQAGAALPAGGVHIAILCAAALLTAMYLTCIGLGTVAFQFARRRSL